MFIEHGTRNENGDRYVGWLGRFVTPLEWYRIHDATHVGELRLMDDIPMGNVYRCSCGDPIGECKHTAHQIARVLGAA